MGCSTTKWDFVQDVWSKGSTSDAVFVPLLRLKTNEAPRIKLAYQLRGATNLRVRRAWRFSNDGETWTAAAEYGDDYGGNGWSWGQNYVPVRDEYQWVELGVNAKNSTGSEMESGELRAIVSTREDPFAAWGDAPTDWGTLEYGCTRTTSGKFRVYATSSPPYAYCDVYTYNAAGPWTLATVGRTTGNPSGPGAWTATRPFWIAWDRNDRTWKVYTDSGWFTGSISTVGSSVVGEETAIARVSVDASENATFEISFDGLRWTTLHTETGPFNWPAIIVRASATYTVQREEIT